MSAASFRWTIIAAPACRTSGAVGDVVPRTDARAQGKEEGRNGPPDLIAGPFGEMNYKRHSLGDLHAALRKVAPVGPSRSG